MFRRFSEKIIASTALVLLVFPGVATATAYSLQVLPKFGGLFGAAYAINNAGEVAGEAGTRPTSDFGFATIYKNGVATNIEPTDDEGGAALSINDMGQAVGYRQYGGSPSYPIIYSDGGLTTLLPFGSRFAQANSINAGGVVVGSVLLDNVTEQYALYSVHHAFQYWAGETTDLGTLGAPGAEAMSINDAGQITGWSNSTRVYTYPGTSDVLTLSGGTDPRAFIYSNGVMRAIGPVNSFGASINDSGHVAGKVVVGTNGRLTLYHAFIYNGSSIIDLGTLGGDSSVAAAINDLDQIVGSSTTGNGTEHGYVYSDGLMQDLNDVATLPDGWAIVAANGINDVGQIVGTLQRVGRSETAGFVLTPIPEPGAMGMLAVGSVLVVGERRRRNG